MRHVQNDAANFVRIGHTGQIAARQAMQQPVRHSVVAAEQPHPPVRISGGGGHEIGELFPRPDRAIVIVAVEDQQMSALLQRIVDVQDEFLAMVDGYVAHYGIKTDPRTLRGEALEWATTRGSRSGRVAWQYVQDLAGRLGVPLQEPAAPR